MIAISRRGIPNRLTNIYNHNYVVASIGRKQVATYDLVLLYSLQHMSVDVEEFCREKLTLEVNNS